VCVSGKPWVIERSSMSEENEGVRSAWLHTRMRSRVSQG